MCLETPCTKSLRIVSVGCCLDTLKWTLRQCCHPGLPHARGHPGPLKRTKELSNIYACEGAHVWLVCAGVCVHSRKPPAVRRPQQPSCLPPMPCVWSKRTFYRHGIISNPWARRPPGSDSPPRQSGSRDCPATRNDPPSLPVLEAVVLREQLAHRIFCRTPGAAPICPGLAAARTSRKG